MSASEHEEPPNFRMIRTPWSRVVERPCLLRGTCRTQLTLPNQVEPSTLLASPERCGVSSRFRAGQCRVGR